jgi:hypothetical protein
VIDVNHTRWARSHIALLLGLALAAGCGDDSDQKADVFIGTWQVIDGSATARCTGISPVSSLGGAQVKMTAGTDSPLQVDVRGCLLKFDINGNTATARANQMCMTTFEVNMSNLQIELLVSKADFTVTGTTGLLSMMGTAKTVFLGDCPYDAMAMATKTTTP